WGGGGGWGEGGRRPHEIAGRARSHVTALVADEAPRDGEGADRQAPWLRPRRHERLLGGDEGVDRGRPARAGVVQSRGRAHRDQFYPRSPRRSSAPYQLDGGRSGWSTPLARWLSAPGEDAGTGVVSSPSCVDPRGPGIRRRACFVQYGRQMPGCWTTADRLRRRSWGRDEEPDCRPKRRFPSTVATSTTPGVSTHFIPYRRIPFLNCHQNCHQ